MNDLVKLSNYCLFTFQATAHALKAEKVLKSAGAEYLTIPTLREISTSCGLSIKVRLEFYNDVKRVLIENKIPFEASYKVEKIGKKNLIEKLS